MAQNAKQYSLTMDQIDAVVNARLSDPFQWLGQHFFDPEHQKGVVVRTFQPHCQSVVLKSKTLKKPLKMEKIDDRGLYEIFLPRQTQFISYTYILEFMGGQEVEVEDPYRFLPVLSEWDLHLFSEGQHHHIYRHLGAHPMEIEGCQGVFFAVWAPNAARISVVGDFNQWDGRCHSMRIRGQSGVWELFIPGLREGTLYKFELSTGVGLPFLKTDPYGVFQEMRPKNASIVYQSSYRWRDHDYMTRRQDGKFLNKAINIYEVHLASWRHKIEEENRSLSYRELADQLVTYVKDMGYTHLELMPIAEYPLDDSWGYQVTGYYAITSRFGTPDDLRYLIDQCHACGIGVILDWVPGHFPKDAFGLARFDGTPLYEHQDPKEGEHPDWGTLIFNYGRNEVLNFLISNAIYWLNEFHFDGLRVDAVASMLYRDYGKNDGEWVPNMYGGNENLEAIHFMRKVNEVVYSYYPNALMIAEESTAFPNVSRPVYLGGLGFGFKWNMGWMHDSLLYFSKDPVHRKYHHNNLTFSLWYAFTENFVLVISHDEVVYGKGSLLNKMPGDLWQKFANLRLFFMFMMTHPGKKLMFMGSEFGQWNEWNFRSSLDWHLLDVTPHRKIHQFVRDLNHLYLNEKPLWENDFDPRGFEWIDYHDADQSIISYIRWDQERKYPLIIILNCTPVPHYQYRIGVPVLADYREMINSDSAWYWGSNVGNGGGGAADMIAWQGQPFSLSLNVPPLGALILKPVHP